MKYKNLKITQIRSSIGILPKHKLTLLGLGLKKIGSFVNLYSNDSTMGMIKKINYMLKIEEL
ncbi:50S ribosomal protein L30 [Buchnera aphidicola]|uniref:50S ribosomal protein L30 n=1 Tax=Buchnera aphidicola TaxID=9 RepID=UPI0031B7EB0D